MPIYTQSNNRHLLARPGHVQRHALQRLRSRWLSGRMGGNRRVKDSNPADHPSASFTEQLAYTYYVDSTPAGQSPVRAPKLRIQTMSPGTGRYSDFIWDPYRNQDLQGVTANHGWRQHSVNELAGENATWPSGSLGGSGWSCTLGCYFPFNDVNQNNLAVRGRVASKTYRSLETYVKSLLAQPPCSEPRCSINDAIITGVQIMAGPDTPDTISYTKNLRISSGLFNWEWIFDCIGQTSQSSVPSPYHESKRELRGMADTAWYQKFWFWQYLSPGHGDE